MRLARSLGPFAFALAAAVACAPDAPSGEADTGFTGRDSAAVRVVENRAPTHMLATEKVLSVGVVSGEENLQFADVRAVRVAPDGGFWVADSNEQIRRYGPEGEYRGGVGGRGEGPGESRFWFGMIPVDGGVLASGSRNLDLFDSGGALVATRPRRTGGRSVTPLAPADGRWLMVSSGFAGDAGELRGFVRFRLTVGLGSIPGEDFDSIAAFPGRALFMRGAEGGSASFFMGNPVLIAGSGGGFHYSDPVEYRVETYGPDGELTRILQRTDSAVAIDPAWGDEIREAVRRRMLESGGGAPTEENVERIAGPAFPLDDLPDHVPFIESLFADGGRLWVRRADRHPDPALRAVAHAYGWVPYAWPEEWRTPSRFDLFDEDGRYEGSVELPHLFTPMDVRDDRIYGVERDALDVEYVAAYRVTGLE